MCAVLEISPKTYYKYRNKEDPDYYDYLIIKEIFKISKHNDIKLVTDTLNEAIAKRKDVSGVILHSD